MKACNNLYANDEDLVFKATYKKDHNNKNSKLKQIEL